MNESIVTHLHEDAPECLLPARSLCNEQAFWPDLQGADSLAGKGRSGFVTTNLPECTWGGGGKAASYGLKKRVS